MGMGIGEAEGKIRGQGAADAETPRFPSSLFRTRPLVFFSSSPDLLLLVRNFNFPHRRGLRTLRVSPHVSPPSPPPLPALQH